MCYPLHHHDSLATKNILSLFVYEYNIMSIRGCSWLLWVKQTGSNYMTVKLSNCFRLMTMCKIRITSVTQPPETLVSNDGAYMTGINHSLFFYDSTALFCKCFCRHLMNKLYQQQTVVDVPRFHSDNLYHLHVSYHFRYKHKTCIVLSPMI